ncbi:uncharacterized protein LOC120250485 [Dioscorea cayenensis subsp. rotundata]|uniref:Uncharacterized protein LOC120250485 n=1 Tax=Dioscorea cayennensis subsp. rotundata TaxID=55577 RepID=A0AB40AJZ6_DIOCR|nr:uncharacterized protein LOC120250485 [Dioscorea cayenensis subsp. rotundata]
MADDLPPFDKISIPGPVLAAILHRCSSSSGDSNGLLFGRAVPLPPREPTDDLGPSPSPTLAAVVTSHLSSSSPASFFDPLGRIDSNSSFLCSPPVPGSHLIGWFSARRRSPLRPSMRERAVSLSLFKSVIQDSADFSARPSVFLLLSSLESGNQAVHTHDYRAFVICPSGALEPRSVSIVNVGPAFRGQYGAFTPESPFPWIPMAPRWKDDDGGERRSLNGLRQVAHEQRVLDVSAEGFGIERLGILVGDGAAEYTSEVEDLYKKMLVKLEGLARNVEESNVRVLEQESRNIELRKKLAGLD